jgi:hypothetical protein
MIELVALIICGLIILALAIYLRSRSKLYTIKFDKIEHFILPYDLKTVKRKLKEAGYEIDYPLQHLIYVEEFGKVQDIGARKIDPRNEAFQTHVRAWSLNGKVAIHAHYEYRPEPILSPEQPLWHLQGVGMKILTLDDLPELKDC